MEPDPKTGALLRRAAIALYLLCGVITPMYPVYNSTHSASAELVRRAVAPELADHCSGHATRPAALSTSAARLTGFR